MESKGHNDTLNMKDDKDLMARFGKKRPFKVPEGYFEHFHEQLMENLPESAPVVAPTIKVSLMERIQPWFYMAAMFAGIIFMVQGLMYVQETRLGTDNIATIEDVYTEEIDHFMSSSLYNEYVLYSYLTTDDYE